MKKVLLVTNIPSPYRVDLFYYLQTHIKQYEFYVIYCAREADNRCWNVDTAKLLNTTFAKTKVISIKRKYDTKHIYIPIVTSKYADGAYDIITENVNGSCSNI